MVPLLSQAAGGGGWELLSSAHQSSLKFANPIPPLFSKHRRNFSISRRLKPLTLANAAESSSGSAASKPGSSATIPVKDEGPSSISLVGQENVPLEGVIQFEKPNSSSILAIWGLVTLLAGGDVAALLLFSAIGRFSRFRDLQNRGSFHCWLVNFISYGSIMSGVCLEEAIYAHAIRETSLRKIWPFFFMMIGWFLSAYFLGGYAEDGRGMNGLFKAVFAAAKSWAVGVPLGLIIRAATIGHTPPTNFILVTMGSTAVLLIGWRTLLFSIFPANNGMKDDAYKRGNPFELFELLTSLVRRW